MKKVYYAHSLHIYNRPQEARDVELLVALGFEVLNPNTEEHSKGYEQLGMAYFKGVVHSCDALAFRGFPDGSIPAGVAKEIEEAKFKGLPIIELPTLLSARNLSVEDTREMLRLSGQR